MRLAICDDDLKEVENLKEQLNAYQHLHEEESFVYKAYSNPVVFLEDWKRNPCDIAMLDIVMPHMSGIQLGSEIKKINPNTILIFLTTSREFALDAYSLRAERYILKPVTREGLFEALDYAHRINFAGDKVFNIKTVSGNAAIKYEQILYIEMSARRMIVHLTDGSEITSIYLRSTFSETVAELLDSRNFVLTHKSFLANMSYVRTYSSSVLTLQANKRSKEEQLPISRQHTASVKQNYLKFMARGTEG